MTRATLLELSLELIHLLSFCLFILGITHLCVKPKDLANSKKQIHLKR